MVMKKYHVLRDNKRTDIPHKIIFYDTEGEEVLRKDNFTYQSLKLFVANFISIDNKFRIETDIWKHGSKIDDFWDFVEQHAYDKSILYLISHNSHYDFNILDGFFQLQKRGYSLRKFIVDSDIFALKWRKDKKVIIAIDNFNYFKFSIHTLGESLNLPKLEIDFDNASFDELLNYCKRDVEILRNTFLNYLKFLKEHDLGNFAITLAGQSFNAFRHRFMKAPIYIHNNHHAIELERRAYRGGRTEAFYLGKVNEYPIYYLDVNSLYPYVMKTFEYPTKFLGFLEGLSIETLEKLLDDYCVIAHVKLFTTKPIFGIKRHKLIFPIGRFRAYLNTSELKKAIEENAVEEIYKVAVYEKSKIFDEYVDYFFKLKDKYKKEGNKVYYLITKLFLNSLYGKFGQHEYKYTIDENSGIDIIGAIRVKDLNNNRKYLQYVLGNLVIEREQLQESFNSFVAIASEVTANARMVLWDYITKAGYENTYYVDTDSLFVNQEGFNNLKPYVDNFELGKLKLEDIFQNLIIHGAKDYEANGIKKLKGVPFNALKISPEKFAVNEFLKTKSLIHYKVKGKVAIRLKIKKLNRVYDKGVRKGNRVYPIILNES